MQAHAVQKCLCKVLLYADGEDAESYLPAAEVVATLIAQSMDQLDSLHINPLIKEARAIAMPDPTGP